MNYIERKFHGKERIPIDEFPSIFTSWVREYAYLTYYKQGDDITVSPTVIFARDNSMSVCEVIRLESEVPKDIPNSIMNMMNIVVCRADATCSECGNSDVYVYLRLGKDNADKE